MITATPDPSTDPSSRPSNAQARGALARALQEPFTVAIRVRANRQVATDAESFRAHIKQLLGAADQDARRAGYDRDYVKLAVYSFIAFLDESVLNSNQPMFASWPRQPLQEEIFGDHVAGETFFRYLHDLLGRQDSEELADVLEVFQLCILLGFRGKFGAGDPSGLQNFTAAVDEKIVRIRGGRAPISPAWSRPANEFTAPAADPWIPRLAIIAAGTLILTLCLYVVFRLMLHSDVADLEAMATQLIR